MPTGGVLGEVLIKNGLKTGFCRVFLYIFKETEIFSKKAIFSVGFTEEGVMKKLILMTCLLLPVSGYGIEGFVSGNILLEKCEDYGIETGGNVDTGRCAGYVMGAVDTHDVYVDWGMIKPDWCLPETGVMTSLNGSHGQHPLVQVVVKYMKEHPQDLHQAAGALVAAALKDTFPCP